jgi:hypothetical protein
MKSYVWCGPVFPTFCESSVIWELHMPWIDGVMGGINYCELAQKNYRRKERSKSWGSSILQRLFRFVTSCFHFWYSDEDLHSSNRLLELVFCCRKEIKWYILLPYSNKCSKLFFPSTERQWRPEKISHPRHPDSCKQSSHGEVQCTSGLGSALVTQEPM